MPRPTSVTGFEGGDEVERQERSGDDDGESEQGLGAADIGDHGDPSAEQAEDYGDDGDRKASGGRPAQRIGQVTGDGFGAEARSDGADDMAGPQRQELSPGEALLDRERQRPRGVGKGESGLLGGRCLGCEPGEEAGARRRLQRSPRSGSGARNPRTASPVAPALRTAALR